MFEIGDIVKYRHWTNKSWEEGEWIIISKYETYRLYDDVWYGFDILNQETGEVHLDINWQQIEQI